MLDVYAIYAPLFDKKATIITVEENSPATTVNDYCSVDLAPVITKCFKNAMLRTTSALNLDLHQFAHTTQIQ